MQHFRVNFFLLIIIFLIIHVKFGLELQLLDGVTCLIAHIACGLNAFKAGVAAIILWVHL